MGRKTYLTVRKRRCNECEEIDVRKKKMCERPPVLRMYGIQDHQPTSSDDSADTVPVNIDPLRFKTVNDDPAGTVSYTELMIH